MICFDDSLTPHGHKAIGRQTLGTLIVISNETAAIVVF
jgi:hypothetical protein